MKKLIFGGLTLATLAVLCSTTGCATAPEETPAEAEPSATNEDALGRDPANCYFHHRYRKYNTTCTWANATWNQKTAIENVVNHAGGVGGCIGFGVAVSALAAGTMTVVLTLPSIGAAATAVGAAGRCGAYIADLINNIFPTSCTTVEVQVTERERGDRCAMACGGTQRVYNGDCYCGRVPLACSDPAPVVTPTPGACNVNWGDGCFNTTACPLSGGRANCSGGQNAARGQRVLNMQGTRYYSCTASGWRGCQ